MQQPSDKYKSGSSTSSHNVSQSGSGYVVVVGSVGLVGGVVIGWVVGSVGWVVGTVGLVVGSVV